MNKKRVQKTVDRYTRAYPSPSLASVCIVFGGLSIPFFVFFLFSSQTAVEARSTASLVTA